MRKIFMFLFCLVAANYILPNESYAANEINLTAGDIVITAQLDDSETTRQFISTLPRTILMTRWGDREFYGKIGRTLSESGEKISDYENGDVTYYAQRGSFAIFYAQAESSSLHGLIRMGKITSDLAAFAKLPDSLEMKIEVR